MQKPNDKELTLLRLIQSEAWFDHEDKRLAPYLDDASTLTNPDTFNRCHDMGWLESRHDNRLDASTVALTNKGREILASTVLTGASK